MEKYKFPENPLEFNSIRIHEKLILFHDHITHKEILFEGDKITIYNDYGNYTKIPLNYTLSTFDYIKQIKECKKLNRAVYKFPENNLGYLYVCILDDSVILYNKYGFVINLYKNKIDNIDNIGGCVYYENSMKSFRNSSLKLSENSLRSQKRSGN